MKYFLCHKEKPLLMFEFNKEIINAVINAELTDFLPLPLKRIIHFESEFIQSSDKYTLTLSEDGCSLVDYWLSQREIPSTRENLKKYIRTGNARQFMLEQHACSLTDCYWVREENESVEWNDVKLYGSDAIESFQVIYNGNNRMYSGVNATLGGQLEKFWYKSKEENYTTLKLCKKVSKANGILAVRELMASQIYEAIGYDKFVHYEPVFDSDDFVIGCKCKAFTNEQTELITAYDLLEEFNLTQADHAYDEIIRLAVSYGCDRCEVEKHLDTQVLVDYLITNRDRHQGNIGFLRDSDSLNIISVAPVFDSGSAAFLEGELPEGVTGTKVNGLYSTEDECLEHVKSLNRFDLAKLPETLSAFTNVRFEVSNYRKKKLMDLYRSKVECLRSLVQSECQDPRPMKV